MDIITWAQHASASFAGNVAFGFVAYGVWVISRVDRLPEEDRNYPMKALLCVIIPVGLFVLTIIPMR